MLRVGFDKEIEDSPLNHIFEIEAYFILLAPQIY